MASAFSADTAPTTSIMHAISVINKTTCFLIISPPKFEKNDILHNVEYQVIVICNNYINLIITKSIKIYKKVILF